MPTQAEVRARFYRRVLKTQTCWLWQGAKDPRGYGRVGAWGRVWLSHRLAWVLHCGADSKSQLNHRCDTPSCVRVDHLFEGTQADNLDDMWRKGRAGNKLTFEQVEQIRELYKTTDASQRDLARRFKVTQAQIYHLVHRKQRIAR